MGVFTASLQAFADKVGDRLDRLTVYCVLEVRTRLIVRSPVDTGRFRGAWIYGLDEAPAGEPGGVDKNGEATAARIEGQISAKAAGHIHWLANNVPYAQSLEDGGSKQAPHGVVKVTLLEWDQIVARAVDALQ